MVVCKYINPPKKVEDSEKFLQEFIPLLTEYWETKGKAEYKGEELSLNVLSFVQMWRLGSLCILMAYEDNKPCGFLLGVRFRPMFYEANAFQIQDWYAPTPEVKDVIFKHLDEMLPLMNIHEVFATETNVGNIVPYKMVSSQYYNRYLL